MLRTLGSKLLPVIWHTTKICVLQHDKADQLQPPEAVPNGHGRGIPCHRAYCHVDHKVEGFEGVYDGELGSREQSTGHFWRSSIRKSARRAAERRYL